MRRNSRLTRVATHLLYSICLAEFLCSLQLSEMRQMLLEKAEMLGGIVIILSEMKQSLV